MLPRARAEHNAGIIGCVKAVHAALCFVFTGCLASDPPRPEIEDAGGAHLLDAMRAQDYRSWENPPSSADLPARRRATGPHGPLVAIHLHPDLLAAFFEEREDALEAWPLGVAAVAEAYADEDASEPTLFHVMQKTDAGWTWGQFDASRRSIGTVPADDCLGCHGAADDFVFSLFLPNGS